MSKLCECQAFLAKLSVDARTAWAGELRQPVASVCGVGRVHCPSSVFMCVGGTYKGYGPHSRAAFSGMDLAAGALIDELEYGESRSDGVKFAAICRR